MMEIAKFKAFPGPKHADTGPKWVVRYLRVIIVGGTTVKTK